MYLPFLHPIFVVWILCRYLAEHPQYAGGVKLSQFSFQIPKPLQENYVRKRPARVIASQDSIKALEPSEGKEERLMFLITQAAWLKFWLLIFTIGHIMISE